MFFVKTDTSMQYGRLDSKAYILRLEKGEKVHNEISSFCKEKQIQNCTISAIGSLENPTLAHYLVDTKKYTEKTLEGIFELTSLTGTSGIFEGNPLVHIHVCLSDEEMRGFGGHLVESIVSATVEVILKQADTAYTKSFDETIGLKLWDLPEIL